MSIAKSASVYECFPFIWPYNAQTVHPAEVRLGSRGFVPGNALVSANTLSVAERSARWLTALSSLT